ncbi:MAG: hypothetical protein R2759_16585 [Bacteroidales bacterium]
MSKIIFDSAISLDGYFAGENRSPQNPMGGVSGKLHQWMFVQKAFWKHIKMEGGKAYGPDSKLIDDVFARTGSYIMGKRMFEEGEVAWAEDLFEADVYVLTHEKREPWVQKEAPPFISSTTALKVRWSRRNGRPKEKTSGYRAALIPFSNTSVQD